MAAGHRSVAISAVQSSSSPEKLRFMAGQPRLDCKTKRRCDPESRRLAGFSAIEILVTIAVASSVVLLAISAAANARSTDGIAQVVRDVSAIEVAVEVWFTANSDRDLSNFTVNEISGYLPGGLLGTDSGGTTTLFHTFGGTYNVMFLMTGTRFQIEVAELPSERVRRLVQERLALPYDSRVFTNTTVNGSLGLQFEFDVLGE